MPHSGRSVQPTFSRILLPSDDGMAAPPHRKLRKHERSRSSTPGTSASIDAKGGAAVVKVQRSFSIRSIASAGSKASCMTTVPPSMIAWRTVHCIPLARPIGEAAQITSSLVKPRRPATAWLPKLIVLCVC
jgi:hypothetical protein